MVLQKYILTSSPPEDEERRLHHVMIRVVTNDRIYLFHLRFDCNIAAFLILFLSIFRIGLQVIVDKK